MFVLTPEDLVNIDNARLTGGRLWYKPELGYLKRKIRDHFIFSENPECCYCRKSFNAEFRIIIDTEHILPQRIYDRLVFEPLNLNIACKRCNMNIKNDNVDFIVDSEAMGTDYFRSEHYKFIHPNLDNYNQHLKRKELVNGSYRFLKFLIKTKTKGQYTYDYFRLKELEIDNINYAQGIKESTTINQKVSEIMKITFLKLYKI